MRKKTSLNGRAHAINPEDFHKQNMPEPMDSIVTVGVSKSARIAFGDHARRSGTNVSDYLRKLMYHEMGCSRGIHSIDDFNGWKRRRTMDVADDDLKFIEAVETDNFTG